MLRHMFKTATGRAPFLDHPGNWSDMMQEFLKLCMQFEPDKRPSAAVLRRHKWVTTKSCNQAEMSRMLRTILSTRLYHDV